MGGVSCCCEDRKELDDARYTNTVLKKALDVSRQKHSELIKDFNEMREDLLFVRKMSSEVESDLKKAQRNMRKYTRALKTGVDATVKSIMQGSHTRHIPNSIEKKYLVDVLTTVYDMVSSK